MRRRWLGRAAAASPAAYLAPGLSGVAVGLVGSQSDFMGVVLVALVGGIYYLLTGFFPQTSADRVAGAAADGRKGRRVPPGFPGPAGGFFRAPGGPWAAGREGFICLGLPPCGVLFLHFLETWRAARDEARLR